MKIVGPLFHIPVELREQVNTDVILASKHLRLPEESLGRHAFSNLLPDFASEVAGHPVLVAGRNFGCGSSREQAPKALRGCGIRVILAPSFGYIFYRNALNLGMAPMVVPDLMELDRLPSGTGVEVDLGTGTVTAGEGVTIQGRPLAPSLMRMIEAGGLLTLLRHDPVALH